MGNCFQQASFPLKTVGFAFGNFDNYLDVTLKIIIPLQLPKKKETFDK